MKRNVTLRQLFYIVAAMLMPFVANAQPMGTVTTKIGKEIKHPSDTSDNRLRHVKKFAPGGLPVRTARTVSSHGADSEFARRELFRTFGGLNTKAGAGPVPARLKTPKADGGRRDTCAPGGTRCPEGHRNISSCTVETKSLEETGNTVCFRNELF